MVGKRRVEKFEPFDFKGRIVMFYEPIDNSGLIIPKYDEIPSGVRFPCTTERMRYDKDDHRYYLTEAALSYYGIDCEPHEIKKLIRTATDHIYSYIAVMAQTKYNLMCYRIAKSNFGRVKTKKEGRLEFERMLAKQAEFINDFGDAKKTPKMAVTESGRVRDNDVDLSSGYWLNDEVLLWLNVNYLTDPNAVYHIGQVNWSEY